MGLGFWGQGFGFKFRVLGCRFRGPPEFSTKALQGLRVFSVFSSLEFKVDGCVSTTCLGFVQVWVLGFGVKGCG